MSHGSMVIVWSTWSRMSSPWLMSRVQAPPGKVTLLERANGFDSVSASGVHSLKFASSRSEVHERKYRLPSEPMASTMSRYWPVSPTL